MEPAPPHLLVILLTTAGISNWIFGGVSWRGQLLYLRNTWPWVSMRWIGVGVVTAYFLMGDSQIRTILGVAGTALVVLGTARTKKKLRPLIKLNSNHER